MFTCQSAKETGHAKLDQESRAAPDYFLGMVQCGAGPGFVGRAAFSFRFGHLHGPWAYPVAVLPAPPIPWLPYETGRYVAVETDEFLRLVLVQCLLGGIGGTLATTTVWGWLEAFRLAPHLLPGLVYTILWLFVALSSPVVYARYR
jgi:hypothetical protein